MQRKINRGIIYIEGQGRSGEGKMASLSDFIEKYIKELLEEAEKDFVELQRRELAEAFRCVPSQINYVLQTRFTPEKGYIVESRRGGGGYIRIVRLEVNPDWELVMDKLMTGVTEEQAFVILDLLVDEEVLLEEEARIIGLILKQEADNLDEQMRATLLRALLMLIENLRR